MLTEFLPLPMFSRQVIWLLYSALGVLDSNQYIDIFLNRVWKVSCQGIFALIILLEIVTELDTS